MYTVQSLQQANDSLPQPSTSGNASTFSLDICKAVVSANIPLWKLEHPNIKAFLSKYTSENIPSESTLRKKYVEAYYDTTMNRIRENIADRKIWVSIDEATDTTGRQIANVIVGVLNTECKGKIYLLNSEELAATNSTTIAQTFSASLSKTLARSN